MASITFPGWLRWSTWLRNYFPGILQFLTNMIFNSNKFLLASLSVADVFVLSFHFTGTDIFTEHELNLSIINDFRLSRPSNIF